MDRQARIETKPRAHRSICAAAAKIRWWKLARFVATRMDSGSWTWVAGTNTGNRSIANHFIVRNTRLENDGDVFHSASRQSRHRQPITARRQVQQKAVREPSAGIERLPSYGGRSN